MQMSLWNEMKCPLEKKWTQAWILLRGHLKYKDSEVGRILVSVKLTELTQ